MSIRVILASLALVACITCLLFASKVKAAPRATGTESNARQGASCEAAWRVLGSPNGGSVDNSLRAVAAAAPNDAWAVGYTGGYGSRTALLEHWNGKNWSLVAPPETGATDSHLQGLAALAPGDIWAVGSADTAALTEHWNGTQWSPVPAENPSLSGNYLNAVTAAGADDVWAVGYYEDAVWYRTLIEHWDGTAWQVIPSPDVPDANNVLLGVYASAAGDVWAVGNYAGGTVLQTLVEHWDGAGWSIVPSPNIASWSTLIGIAALAPDDAWAVGAYADFAPMGTLVEHWDGVTWNIVPAVDAGPVASLLALSPDDIWGVGEKSATNSTLIEHWNGTEWSEVRADDPGNNTNYLYGIAGTSPDELWTVGDYTNSDWIGNTLIERYSGPCATPASTATATPSATPSPNATQPPTVTPGASVTAVSTATGTVTPTPTACDLPFSDVQPSDYFYASVHYLYCAVAVSGYADRTFRPYANSTRGQVTKMLILAEGWPLYSPSQSTFRDVQPGDPFFAYVETAYIHGAISGYSCGQGCLEFFPSRSVTRAQVTKLVVLAAGWQVDTPPHATFRDVPPGDPFFGYVETAHNHGVISGYSCGVACLEFRAGGSATRGQAAKVLYSSITGR